MCKKEKCERETKSERETKKWVRFYNEWNLLTFIKKKKEPLSAHVEKLYSSHSRPRHLSTHLSTILLKDSLLFKIAESAYDKKIVNLT